MIGKYSKGLRHLIRSVGENPTKLLLINGGEISVAHAAVMKTRRDGEQLILFQNRGGDRDYSTKLCDDKGIAKELLSTKYNYFYVIFDSNRLNQFAHRIIILPDNFDEQYEKFINDNKKTVLQTLTKLGCTHHPISYFIYCISDGSPNFFTWAITNRIKNNVNINLLVNILKWNENYGKLSSKLLNGTITAYNSREKAFSLYNEMMLLRRTKRANDVINSFNTAQKKLLKGIELDEKNLLTFSKFGKLSNTKKLNFIRKMSTIDSADEIMKQMKLLVKIHYEWNKESFMEFLRSDENFKYEIVYDNGDIVVLSVSDYETIKHIAKTTNWCISKNMQYWNNYMQNPNCKQYVMYDFSKNEDDELSIVGFTTISKSKILHAHSFTNVSLMCQDKALLSKLNTVLTKNDIYSIIKDRKIPMNTIFDFSNKKYEWDRESFIAFLNYAIGEDNYDVIKDNNNHFVFITNHDNIRFVIGDNYRTKLSNPDNKKHIVFCDFEKENYNSEKIYFAIINKNTSTEEEYVSTTYDCSCSESNESFDELLSRFELPYDTIARVYDEEECLKDNILSFNFSKVGDAIKDKKRIIKIFKDEDVRSDMNDNLYRTANNCSFDLINFFYDNGYKLCELLTPSYVASVVRNAIYMTNEHRVKELPTKEDYDKMMNHELPNRKVFGIFNYFFAKQIIDTETDDEFFKNIARAFDEISRYSPITNELCNILIDKIELNDVSNDNINLIEFLITNKKHEKLSEILSKPIGINVVNMIRNNVNDQTLRLKCDEILNNKEKEVEKKMEFSFA